MLKPVKHTQLFNILVNILFNNSHIIRDINYDDLEKIVKINYDIKILIAEDNPINQKLALRMLEKIGHKADTVSNGLEVIERLKTNKYDIIFMDIQMPEMDGIEATKHIISNYKDSKPQIIAMTANAMKEDRDICLNSGMDDYISKPVSINDIKNILIKWSNNRLKESYN